MRTTITTLILLLVFMIAGNAQEVTKELYLAIKGDNASALKSEVKPSDHNLCFDAKGNPYSLLALTIKANALACFDYLISQDSIDLNKNCSGKTPLLYTAKYGRLEMLKKLLEKGADTTIKNNGKSVLDYAKKYKQKRVVQFLVNN